MNPKKILVVEDSTLLQNMYKMMLRNYRDCQLVSAGNGREALDYLAGETDVDLIILDINMPVMTGIEFLEAIKQNDACREIPVIIISTEGKEADVERGLKLGANTYITKPFQSATLHSAIESLFGKATGA